MTLKLGSTTINKMYLGATEVNKAYLGSTLVFDNSGGGYTPSDPDAAAYISAVEAADEQTLEVGVKQAIDTFVLGCKSDGVWSSLNSAFIFMGARTIAGASIALVGPNGTANNYTSGDYSRTDGLVGNRTTKYFDTNYDGSNLLVEDSHLSAMQQSLHGGTVGTLRPTLSIMGSDLDQRSMIYEQTNDQMLSGGGVSSDYAIFTPAVGWHSLSRGSSSQFTGRQNALTQTKSHSQTGAHSADNVRAHVRGIIGGVHEAYGDARLQWISAGTDVNQNLLRLRVETLVSDIATALS